MLSKEYMPESGQTEFGNQSAFVDVYDLTSNSWTRHPSGLGEARGFLAAATLPSGLVFFAGGFVDGAAKCVCCIHITVLFDHVLMISSLCGLLLTSLLHAL